MSETIRQYVKLVLRKTLDKRNNYFKEEIIEGKIIKNEVAELSRSNFINSLYLFLLHILVFIIIFITGYWKNDFSRVSQQSYALYFATLVILPTFLMVNVGRMIAPTINLMFYEGFMPKYQKVYNIMADYYCGKKKLLPDFQGLPNQYCFFEIPNTDAISSIFSISIAIIGSFAYVHFYLGTRYDWMAYISMIIGFWIIITLSAYLYNKKNHISFLEKTLREIKFDIESKQNIEYIRRVSYAESKEKKSNAKILKWLTKGFKAILFTASLFLIAKITIVTSTSYARVFGLPTAPVYFLNELITSPIAYILCVGIMTAFEIFFSHYIYMILIDNRYDYILYEGFTDSDRENKLYGIFSKEKSLVPKNIALKMSFFIAILDIILFIINSLYRNGVFTVEAVFGAIIPIFFYILFSSAIGGLSALSKFYSEYSNLKTAEEFLEKEPFMIKEFQNELGSELSGMDMSLESLLSEEKNKMDTL